MDNWKIIWDHRKPKKIHDLQDLINANGFDTSGLLAKNLKNYIDLVIAKLGMLPEQSVFEVGCGCGSILYLLHNANLRVGGVDYSASLIEIAKKLNLSNDISIGFANEIQIEPKYDYVISNSITQYFSDLNYVESVACLMMKKSLKGSIAILDINDLAKEKLYLSVRRKAESNYDEKYKNHQHLFINKLFWYDLAAKFNWSITIEDQNIPEYKNSQFRYNAFITTQ